MPVERRLYAFRILFNTQIINKSAVQWHVDGRCYKDIKEIQVSDKGLFVNKKGITEFLKNLDTYLFKKSFFV